MGLVKNLPKPPEITPEVKKRISEESKLWAEEFRKKIREMENLTPYDWGTRVR